MPSFNFGHIQFYYEDDGGEGEPFIFLHGLGGDTSQTFGLMKPTEQIRRISLDFRGHGRTAGFGKAADFSFRQFADDVIALTEHLGIAQFNIGGISTGAGVALNLALRYPDRIKKLVLSRPAWTDQPQDELVREAFAAIHRLLEHEEIAAARTSYANSDSYKTLNALSSYAGDSLLSQFNYPYVKETSVKFVKLPNDCPNQNREEWKNLKPPVLILASRHDPIHPFSYGLLLHEYIPNSRFIEVTSKTVSSTLHTQESYEAVTRFLKESVR